jgi:hypothetical protein
MRTKPARMALAGVFTLLSSYFCFQSNVFGERERRVAETEKVDQIGRRIAKGQIYMIAI